VRIHALSTPGHTPHCMSFIIDDEEKKILIGGDTVWGGFHPYIQSDKDVWKQSLTVLDDIPFTTLIPGHGNPSLRENAHNSFTRAVSHFAASSHPSFRGMTTLWSE
jgi:hydroxyacylglutathione hydrolase